jgi:hypothetical protein
MIPFLGVISSWVPQSFGIEGVRAVMSKGAGITTPQVYAGIVYPNVWTMIHLLLGAYIGHRSGV